MALDLEEQEQLAALRAWWRDNGGRVIFIVAAALVAIAAVQGWRIYQGQQAAQASVLHDTLDKAVRAGDAKAVRDAAGALAESYPRTLYASMGALAAARFYFDRSDLKNAKAQLQWVMERTRSEDLRALAQLRMAAVVLDEGNHDEALKLVASAPVESYTPHYAALRGDVYVAKRALSDAKAAYQLALDKTPPGQQDGLRESVRMRLEALGN